MNFLYCAPKFEFRHPLRFQIGTGFEATNLNVLIYELFGLPYQFVHPLTLH